MRTSQWIRAGNGFDAVINAIVWHTAIIWVPLLVIGGGGYAAYDWYKSDKAAKAQARYEKTPAYAAEIAQARAVAERAARLRALEARALATAPWPALKCEAMAASAAEAARMARLGYGVRWADKALAFQADFAAHCLHTQAKPTQAKPTQAAKPAVTVYTPNPVPGS